MPYSFTMPPEAYTEIVSRARAKPLEAYTKNGLRVLAASRLCVEQRLVAWQPEAYIKRASVFSEHHGKNNSVTSVVVLRALGGKYEDYPG